MRIVIIGNGVAGIEAALTVREQEPSWDLTIISEESDHFFSRTALMWVFSGQMSHQDIEPLERDVYERLNIRRVRARAVGLDVKTRQVFLAGGLGSVPYDRLLIASGSRPRPAPWEGSELRGVGHFVTLQDLDWYQREVHGGSVAGGSPPRADAHVTVTDKNSPYLFREVAAQRRGVCATKPAIIGGGLIGIEAIEVAVAAGLRPHFFIREDWFWPIALEPRESKWISDRMSEHGVHVHLNHDIQSIEGDSHGNVTHVHTDLGSYGVDCVVVAIGVIPNTEWLETSAVERDKGGGITVNAELQTSAHDVFAAGDCASVKWFDGSQRPEQLWYTARDQGKVAGRRLLGMKAEYSRGVWYNSAKLMDMEYTTVGLVNWNVAGEKNWFFEEKGPIRSTTRIVVEGDRVIGFNLLGRRWDHTLLIRWIEERRSLSWVIRNIHKASFDTEFVPLLRLPRVIGRVELEGPAPNPIIPGPTQVPF